MSLAAALKKGLETADTIGNWDPFAEPQKDAANANVVGTTVARTTSTPNPIATVKQSRQAELKADPEVRALEQAAAATPKAARKQVRRPAQKPAQKPAQRASWLPDTVQGARVNAAQYVRELDRFATDETRRAVADVVMDVNPNEIEGIVQRAARIKGRYLAKLLDMGSRTKSGVQEAEIAELTRYRETYEELARGLDLLKTAIESGDIRVSGTVRG